MRFTATEIVELFSDKGSELRYKDLARSMKVQGAERREFKQLLARLVREDVLRLRKGRWYRLGPQAAKLPELAIFKSGKTLRDDLFTRLFAQAQWPDGFGTEAIQEATEASQPLENIPADATDMRHIPFVTIDPEDARDYDDAVAAETIGKNSIRLHVAIADVSRYVLPNSALDREALARSTSVYLPGSVEPMLPFELSAGICSLKPDENRMALVASMDFDSSGKRVAESFSSAMIRSRKRLSYAEAQNIIDGESKIESELKTSFEQMAALFHRLETLRSKRGTLELNIPEAKVLLGDAGEIVDIRISKALSANKLIEEFMIAANSAVAETLLENDIPGIFRIHEDPDEDKLSSFRSLVNSLSLPFLPGKKISGRMLNRFLESLSGKEESRYLHTMLLRSLKQARYSPVNSGHFGLSLPAYCHFTSPIRRYPDLEVHRRLKSFISNGKVNRDSGKTLHDLAEIAQHCSDLERQAMLIERKAIDICQAELMQSKLGEEFEGVISGVENFGIFVQISRPYVEGRIGMSQLGDDYYVLDEERRQLVGQRNARRFRLGDRISVRIAGTDIERGWIDLQLADIQDSPPPRRRKKKHPHKRAKGSFKKRGRYSKRR